MAAQSKLLEAAINCSCQPYVHPWTTSCASHAAGMLLSGIPGAFKTYSTVYLAALVMRMRVPTLLDLKRTVQSILTSTTFLASNGFLFGVFVCLLRYLLGRFYFSTVVFVPALIAARIAITIERPVRRAPLAFYVANVATESLWKMLEARGWVRSLPNGQVLILGISLTALLYMYRTGVHLTKPSLNDATFKALRIVIGKQEEGPLRQNPVITQQTSRHPPLNLRCISSYVQLYDRLTKFRHPSCPHTQGCLTYALRGGLRPFLGGVGLQVGLKLLLNATKIFKLKMQWRKQIFNKGSLQLGLALGSFSLLYKAISCALRNSYGYDSALFALPAGLVGTVGLFQFPNTTIALYVMWKALQLFYSWGLEQRQLPEVPHFIVMLYAVCTGILFHCAILEAGTLRDSYYKFLMNISGQRIARYNVKAFEVFGLKSQQQISDVVKKLNINMSAELPKFALVV
ncbi:transmembrane protein 135 [Drosophila busckii]|uniref:transmembrane protein 135 n=1 Tax=Drosophila busckii TaxID=30019 RepID=UPI00083F0691|nr:transmembrane protein 135 [Drosophila busckii]XP_017845875.1 transmembrane protein 135 [Drosophila busckii]